MVYRGQGMTMVDIITGGNRPTTKVHVIIFQNSKFSYPIRSVPYIVPVEKKWVHDPTGIGCMIDSINRTVLWPSG